MKAGSVQNEKMIERGGERRERETDERSTCVPMLELRRGSAADHQQSPNKPVSGGVSIQRQQPGLRHRPAEPQ